jgi:hypothetical protein
VVAAVCGHAAPEAHSETAPAKINPAAIRILFFPCADPVPGPGLLASPEPLCAPAHNSLDAPVPPRQRLLSTAADLSAEPVNSRKGRRVRFPRAPAQSRF